MTKVKICGITNLADAQLAVDLGADMLGFNFYEKSPRYIAPGSAKAIIESLEIGTRSVGVFVNENIDRVHDIAVDTLIATVQLHGDESPYVVERLHNWLGLEVIRALRISSEFEVGMLDEYGEIPFLLDTFSPSVYGGSGETGNWDLAEQIVRSRSRVYLAGGLTPKNVAAAVKRVRPWAVDVASGVESSPGVKDPKKLEAFIKNAKNA